jgi:predicted negative regulator of RcsB-dependent stress response
MSDHEKRISHLEDQVEKHLEEAGEVREALRWLKKSHWTLVVTILTAIATEVGYRILH